MTVSPYIQKCMEDVCVSKHIKVMANDKPWITTEVGVLLRLQRLFNSHTLTYLNLETQLPSEQQEPGCTKQSDWIRGHKNTNPRPFSGPQEQQETVAGS